MGKVKKVGKEVKRGKYRRRLLPGVLGEGGGEGVQEWIFVRAD